MAALPAERDVQVEAERHAWQPAARAARASPPRSTFSLRPDRERRIGRDEVAADIRLIGRGQSQGFRQDES